MADQKLENAINAIRNKSEQAQAEAARLGVDARAELTQALQAAKARGIVGGTRSQALATGGLRGAYTYTEAEVGARFETEAAARRAGAEEFEEWQESMAAGRTVQEENVALRNQLEEANAMGAALAAAASTARHTVQSDLGDLSHGMAAGEKPVAFLDGLPWSWCVTTSISPGIQKRLVTKEGFTLKPVGRRTDVHTVDCVTGLTVHVQRVSAVLKLMGGGADEWETYPLAVAGGAAPPTGVPAACWVRPASAAIVDKFGLDTATATGAAADDARWAAAVAAYTTSRTPLSANAFRGAGAIFDVCHWVSTIGYDVHGT